MSTLLNAFGSDCLFEEALYRLLLFFQFFCFFPSFRAMMCMSRSSDCEPHQGSYSYDD